MHFINIFPFQFLSLSIIIDNYSIFLRFFLVNNFGNHVISRNASLREVISNWYNLTDTLHLPRLALMLFADGATNYFCKLSLIVGIKFKVHLPSSILEFLQFNGTWMHRQYIWISKAKEKALNFSKSIWYSFTDQSIIFILYYFNLDRLTLWMY